jgi:hypothetical protein
MSERLSISPRLRLVLLLKSLLLLALSAIFGFIAIDAIRGDHAWWQRIVGLLTAFPAPFLVAVSRWGLLDALQGEARSTEGTALDRKGRRWGYSLRLPDGHFAEFPLFNPGTALVPGQKYALVVGRWSRVIVEPPRAVS